MKLKTLSFVAALAWVPALMAADVVWVGGVDQLFSTAANWETAILPTAADRAVIGTGPVVLANTAATVVDTGALLFANAVTENPVEVSISDGSATFAGMFTMGSVAGARGKLTVTGGKIACNKNVSPTLDLASVAGSSGEMVMSGGEIAIAQNVFMGGNGSMRVTQTGGLFTGTQWLALGRYATSDSSWEISGGEIRMTNTGTGFYVGEEGHGTLTVKGTGKVSVAGRLAFNGGSTVNLQMGGEIAAGYVERGKTTITGDPVINFDGGTLRALGTAHLNPWINANVTRLYVTDGGAIIDIPEGEAVVNSPFAVAPNGTTGGLTKRGNGTLKLMAANTYPGVTTIEAGHLVVNGANGIAASSAITVAAGAGFGVNMADFAAWKSAISGKTTWAPGSFFVADTSSGDVAVAATDLPAGAELAKTGANVLTITSPLQGVTEIRIYGGIVKAGTADAIPATTKITLLGGSYAPFDTTFTDAANQLQQAEGKPLGLAAVTTPLTLNLGNDKRPLTLNGTGMSSNLILNETGADQPITVENPVVFATKDAAYEASIAVNANTATLKEQLQSLGANVTKSGAGTLVLEKGVDMAGRNFTAAGGTVQTLADCTLNWIYANGGSTITFGPGASFTGTGLCASSSGVGTVNLTGGNVSCSDELSVAFNTGNTGTINQSGGTVQAGNWFSLGRMGIGTYNLTGGTLEAITNTGRTTADDWSYLGGLSTGATAGTSKLNISGADTLFHVRSNFQVGRYKTAELNLSGGTAIADYWVSLARNSGAVGTINVTGGTFRHTHATYGLFVGEQGAGTLNVSGTGRVETTAPIYACNGTAASGAVNVSNGGTLISAGFILNTPTRPFAINVDGGTIGAIGEGKLYNNFFERVQDISVGPNGMTFDTGDNTVNVQTPLVTMGSSGTITKIGSGTLVAPPEAATTGGIVVKEGTLEAGLSLPTTTSSGTPAATVPHLLHRWSFTDGSRTDTVGGSSLTTIGSVTFTDNKMTLAGGSKGTSWVNLGANLIPTSGPFTIEVFARQDAIQNWGQILAFGKGGSDATTQGSNFHMSWTYQKDIAKERVEIKSSSNSTGTFAQDGALQPYTLGTNWHIAVTFQPLPDGRMKMFFLKEALDGSGLRFFERTTANPWSVADITSEVFWLGHSPWADNDASATYDEVRVWDCAFPLKQLTCNAKLGPDKLPNFDSLVHRWSFSGDLVDSVGGTTGTAVGSTSFSADNTQLVLPGGKNGTGYVNLGLDLVPTSGEPVTIEIWATERSIQTWGRIFDYGSNNQNYYTLSWTQSTSQNTDRSEIKSGNAALFTTDNTMQPYALNTPYHIAVTGVKNANGTSTLTWSRRNVTTGALEKRGSATTNKAWTFGSITGANFFLGHSQYSGDNDAAANYDEVRVWRGALSDAQLETNAKLGPDVLPTKVEFATAASQSLYSPLVVEEGATFSTGSNAVTAETVQGTGTLVGGGTLTIETLDIAADEIGTLTADVPLVVKNWVVDLESDADSDRLVGTGTLDVSGLVVSVRDPSKLKGSYTLANVGSISGRPKLAEGLEGVRLMVHGSRLVLLSEGLMIFIR